MRGLTLEEISLGTKIGLRALQALESNEFSKLPGGMFNRSFLRQYARYLGLDEEKVMAEYELVAPRDDSTDLRRISQQRPLHPKPALRAPWVVLVIAVVLLAGGFGLYRFGRRVPRQSAASAAPATSPAEEPAAPSAATPAPSGAASEATNAAAPATQAPVAAPGELVLQVAATEPSWVGIDADGKMAMQRVMSPNEIQTFHARRFFDVIAGNAQGIILTLNGETLEPLGHHGEVRKVHLTLQDVKKSQP